MARKATGAVVEHTAKNGQVTRSLRFSAYGKRRYIALGAVSRGGRARAPSHPRRRRAGIWRAPRAIEPAGGGSDSRFSTRSPRSGGCATSRLAPPRRRVTAGASRATCCRTSRTCGSMRSHSTPWNATSPRSSPRRNRCRGRSINMTITLLGAILEGAVERELIGRNPARGRRRRVRQRTPRPAIWKPRGRSPLCWTRRGARSRGPALRPAPRAQGDAVRADVRRLRIGEMCGLRWRDVDLATGWLNVGESKTDAGRRRVKIRGALGDELRAVRARNPHAAGEDFVFPSRGSGRQDDHNFRGVSSLPAWSALTRTSPSRVFRRCPRGSRRTRSGGRSRACCTRSVRTRGS